MNTAPLLVELFVEELPPKALQKLGDAFASVLRDQLVALELADASAQLTAYASPRRLAAHLSAVRAQAPDKAISQKLMPVSVGLDASGQATPALLKKLSALGADASAVAQLKRAPDGKAEVLFYESTARGATLAEGLQKALDEAIRLLPIPKVMRYQLQDGWSSVNFVRPAHGLVALHGSDVVPVTALGLSADRTTQGHRFEASVHPVALTHADHYAAQLRSEGAVIASFAERRAEIVRQLQAAAERIGGGVRPIEDDALLDEVTALVERPNVLVCQFEQEFLAVPQECLILTMKANQKYFPLLNAEGKLTHQFLIVSNITPQDASAVIEGNERVVRPRLADAKFFFDQDRKKTLVSRVPQLDKVVYHNQLGTQGERVQRVRAIAQAIGAQLFAALSQRHDIDGTQDAEVVQDYLMTCVDNAALLDFIFERLAGSLREQGYRAQEVDAVLALRPPRLSQVPQRLAAVRAFASLPEALAHAAANKRITNILKKAGPVDAHVNPELLLEQAEKDLFIALQRYVPESTAQFEAGDYTASLQTLAILRAPVDAFFDDVMVNAEQLDLRLNRQGLLKMLHQAMNRVGDLSRLAV